MWTRLARLYLYLLSQHQNQDDLLTDSGSKRQKVVHYPAVDDAAGVANKNYTLLPKDIIGRVHIKTIIAFMLLF